MLLGGLWHGAGWTFVVWGGLHGLYLVVHHAWMTAMGGRRHRQSQQRRHRRQLVPGLAWVADRAHGVLAWALTLLAVVVGWVFFRSATLAGAGRMLAGMTVGAPVDTAAPALWNAGLHLGTGAMLCAALTLMALWPMNSNRLGERALDVCRTHLFVRVAAGSAAVTAVLLLMLLNLSRDAASAFIYFNF
jgi:alginate O-acetyltransferase complex protein AlgI